MDGILEADWLIVLWDSNAQIDKEGYNKQVKQKDPAT